MNKININQVNQKYGYIRVTRKSHEPTLFIKSYTKQFLQIIFLAQKFLNYKKSDNYCELKMSKIF